VPSKPVETTAERPHPMGWITTFNDLITLLMVFFVLLFALGNIDMQRYKRFQSALQSTMGVLQEGQSTSVGVISAGQPSQSPSAVKAPDADRRLEELCRTDGLEAEFTARGIQLTLNDEMLFATGSAQLTESGMKMLARVGAVIRSLERTVQVEGHTDLRPIATTQFPSNWELSTQRAVNVVKYFVERVGIPPQLLSAAGYGESRPREDDDSASAHSRNRRVEIILGERVP
jgi:chemotaxis protein MotB